MKTILPRTILSAAICGALLIANGRNLSAATTDSSPPSAPITAVPATTATAPAPAAATTPASVAASAAPADTTPAAASATAPARAARVATPQHVGGIQGSAGLTKSSYKFYFGTGDAPAGATKVTPDMVFSEERGFGFEPGSTMKAVAKDKSGKSTDGVVTADKQFYFSTALPEGNYKVTVTLGNPDTATTTTVKAELRRLMLETVATKPGEYVTKTFLVNTRIPQYPGGQVSLKDTAAPNPHRETIKEAWAWDKGLTLEFNGVQPTVAALDIEKADNVPVVYIVGDSTSCDQPTEPYDSWGQMFTNFFKSDIVIANHGESGESYVSSLGAHRFDKVWSLMKPGDYLLTQFGHNDSKVANALQVYVASMKKVVDGTKKAGGNLILVTPVSRAPGAANLDAYAAATRQMGKDENVPVVDLYALSQTLYGAYGKDALSTLFCNTAPGKYDTTHHGPFGSYEIAKCVVSAIQKNNPDLAKHIMDGFSFDPAKPDKAESFKVPPSKFVDTTKPLGE